MGAPCKFGTAHYSPRAQKQCQYKHGVHVRLTFFACENQHKRDYHKLFLADAFNKRRQGRGTFITVGRVLSLAGIAAVPVPVEIAFVTAGAPLRIAAAAVEAAIVLGCIAAVAVGVFAAIVPAVPFGRAEEALPFLRAAKRKVSVGILIFPFSAV